MLSYALGQVYNEESLEAARAAAGLAEGRDSAALSHLAEEPTKQSDARFHHTGFHSIPHTPHSYALGVPRGDPWRPCAHAGGGHSVHLVWCCCSPCSSGSSYLDAG